MSSKHNSFLPRRIHRLRLFYTPYEDTSCVIREEGKTIDPHELATFCAERMEEYMVPRYIEFRNDFPRSSRGKVQRFRLRDREVTGRMWDRHRQG